MKALFGTAAILGSLAIQDTVRVRVKLFEKDKTDIAVVVRTINGFNGKLVGLRPKHDQQIIITAEFSNIDNAKRFISTLETFKMTALLPSFSTATIAR